MAALMLRLSPGCSHGLLETRTFSLRRGFIRLRSIAASSSSSETEESEDDSIDNRVAKIRKALIGDALVDKPRRKRPPVGLEFLLHREEKHPNYAIWAAGILFAIAMRETIIQETLRWPGFFRWLYTESIALSKMIWRLLLKLMMQYAKEPLAKAIVLGKWAEYLVTMVYTQILQSTPILEITTKILLCTAVISIGEAAGNVDAASHHTSILLTATSLLSAAVYFNVLPSDIFLALLAAVTVISYLFHRNAVTATLPAAAALAAIARPKLQYAAVAGYAALAAVHNWLSNSSPTQHQKQKRVESPLLLYLLAAMVIVNCAVNFTYARHLTWMTT